ncbi:MAG: 50S ribosomal protein L28 [Candidatus Limiplasma sp.]|nr:50S ribosomal protein L28 [Candidatus Limiplasma sp.]
MGKFCEVCEKGTLNGNSVSHSNRKTHRLWAPNVQRVRVEVAGQVRHMNVCTRCLRSGNVKRALPTNSHEVAAEA